MSQRAIADNVEVFGAGSWSTRGRRRGLPGLERSPGSAWRSVGVQHL